MDAVNHQQFKLPMAGDLKNRGEPPLSDLNRPICGSK